ncbi:hypothetical protein B0J13DRAFT_647188 [Dactylonectria estremocensis]|uniref:Uncharacterized protein n=1 Tax=Dactylonectria estremocensis TaxID=1079267 RepID=A0A9P9DTZ1_9HYPO|nr:hypothetical protein B0J13DRAFT_647188 [Dactylonectria estremocensis]
MPQWLINAPRGMMKDGAISDSPPETGTGGSRGLWHELAPRLVPGAGESSEWFKKFPAVTINMCGRSVELHYGQTEELMLPETSHPMLSDQLEITRLISKRKSGYVFASSIRPAVILENKGIQQKAPGWAPAGHGTGVVRLRQKLRQSFTPPASQAVDISPSDKEAPSASRESRHAAIWISDNETDTEDEDDDEGQDFDNSQSYTTPTTSIADHLDSTGTKYSPTQLEAAADTSFEVSPTRPESQPCLSVSGEQQLVTEATEATSEPGIIMIDALSDEGSCHGAQSTPTSPSIHTYSPITASPEEMAYMLLYDSEMCLSTSRDDAIPGAHISSPAVRLSPELQQEQDIEYTSCGFSDAEPESSEAESRSPFRAHVSPPSQELPSRRHSRRRSSYIHQTVQDKDSDVDTEGSGSEDGLDVRECVCDEDYCPSPPKVQGSGSEDDNFNDEKHQDHKRRKVSRSPSYSICNAATSARDSRRRRRSIRAIAHSLRERDMLALGLLSLIPSHARSIPSEAIKRITENGKTTF